ncbi:unnamed protein product [Bemisia tabaci]|uniref:Uncharacterized protein n=1 Tax=Bemisia tabaci TaxID=7038 RepID=A0A9P0F8C4_BEMTA|nr:unnamed protein product [Bemisia tabaci]
MFMGWLSLNDDSETLKFASSKLEHSVKCNPGPVLLMRDFNLSSELWGNVKVEKRGNILAEWILAIDLVVSDLILFHDLDTFTYYMKLIMFVFMESCSNHGRSISLLSAGSSWIFDLGSNSRGYTDARVNLGR